MLTKIVVKLYSDEQLMGIDVSDELLSQDDLIDLALTMPGNWESNVVYRQSESGALNQPMLTIVESKNPVYGNCRVTFITSRDINDVMERIESYINIARNAMFYGKKW